MVLKKNSKLFLVVFLGMLSAFGPFILDLYLPALPMMSDYFGVDTTIIQLTLTGSMIGLSVGQLIIGPISDKVGRKLPLIFSLIVYILSTLFIVIADNVYLVIVLRFIQGFSAAGSVVISRAVATDLYGGKGLKEFFSLLMTINGLAPIIAPIFGGIIIQFTSWKNIFTILTVLGIILLIVSLNFSESLERNKRFSGSLVETYQKLFKILKNKLFITYILVQSFAMSSLFGYISASPFIFQEKYGVSAFTYSLFFGLNGLALIIGSRISNLFNSKKAISIGLKVMIIISSYITITLILKLNVLFVEFGFFILLIGLGIILPATSSSAMNSERDNAGGASALLGFFQFLFGGLVSPLVGLGNILYATSLVLLISSVIALLLYSTIKD
ncbi:multidrug effflux MFS transporter [Gemella sp. GH3]|uniref:multidrug effflux MFS transporter n=1 Tax=unclassified Gemella TaxID=2624949 RepID=UPI0015D052AC|nr:MULTISPECIES: multidrug effflux MFS transporter [unclassified Gemella]MBF0714099.1 multidrug effflux MFS transporter [Gemella sp. GH3.1]NYS51051.1 multidrug effflux MFS transporter [Gemella sp. GH3]